MEDDEICTSVPFTRGSVGKRPECFYTHHPPGGKEHLCSNTTSTKSQQGIVHESERVGKAGLKCDQMNFRRLNSGQIK